MGILSRIARAVRRTVRYKLLLLVLFPIVLVMPIALGLAVYWSRHFGYDQLFIKVNTDLSVAHDAFQRAQRDYMDAVGRMAESYRFRTDYHRGDDASLRRLLANVQTRYGFAFLHLVNRQGQRLLGKGDISSPLLEQAAMGEPGAGIEILSAGQLAREDPALAARVRLPLLPTPRATPTDRRFEDRGMLIRVAYPVRDAYDNVRAVVDGGVLLNGNFDFVDGIRDLVYGPGSLLEGSVGAVTVLLSDVRISTNVRLRPGERALGTRVSGEVREQVLDRGEVWIDRAFVVNDWYISAYEPILDVKGQRVGMLYSGFLEAPFRSNLIQALVALILLFLCLMALSAALAVEGARSVFKPLESMSAVVRATRRGEQRRIGDVASQDEIGELAREFDAMLQLLQQRNREIQEAADSLEQKVELRTAELKRRNADLQRTIELLREARHQLVMAEKLVALGELTAGMAHEINNPMTVILGNLDLLVEELGSAAEPARREIELIVEQVYRVKEIIDNLLQYARPSRDRGELAVIGVAELFKDTLRLVQHMTHKSHIALRLSSKATRPVRIHRQELQQVLVNLLVNAVHALEGQTGTIHLQSRDWDEKGVVISVRDSGPGIPPEQLDRVFTPFYSTKATGKGTGLGLSISYDLVRRYGGTITVQSPSGQGAEFRVWLLSEPELSDDDTTIAEHIRSMGMDEQPAAGPNPH